MTLFNYPLLKLYIKRNFFRFTRFKTNFTLTGVSGALVFCGCVPLNVATEPMNNLQINNNFSMLNRKRTRYVQSDLSGRVDFLTEINRPDKCVLLNRKGFTGKFSGRFDRVRTLTQQSDRENNRISQ